ncbi:MAG TPA: isocitrate/isopropylmalate family dehydrogenase [Gaiellaceae bacterium]|jgi:3-isopropylmalate dehydrogenase
MSGRTYSVAFLAGDGIGPEVTAQASRSLAAVSRLHNVRLEELHVPFDAEARVRSGLLLPIATRTAYLSADAVLAAAAGAPALASLAADLDLRAQLTQVRLASGADVALLRPLASDTVEWTVERAFALARRRRGRLTFVRLEPEGEALAEELVDAWPALEREHMAPAAAIQQLALAPERFDVVVSGTLYGEALAEVAAYDRRSRVAARALLAAQGPSVFMPTHGRASSIAGQGVANPSSILLASSLLLGEGLGERGAALTLADAVDSALRDGVRTPDLVRSGVAATTGEFVDDVLGRLQVTVANAEFARGAWA